MKTVRRVVVTFVCVFFTFNAIPLSSAAISPLQEIQSTIDAVLDVLKDENLRLPANKEKRRAQIRSLISERFDFEEMAKRSLARHWKKRTSAEKKEFVNIFSELLEASYVGKIESYTSEKISYNKEVLKGSKYAVVDTSVITKKVTIPIEYKVIRKNNKWRVYDVVIEGVSFISTYRSQYNTIIKKESYQSLIKSMKSKLDEVNNKL
jgi:phospholipid transport system substrate-binding protein